MKRIITVIFIGGCAHIAFAQNFGIDNSNPLTKLHIQGVHQTTQMRLTLPAANNGAGNGEVNMQLWVSEPGITWEAGGIGTNVTNDNGAPAGFGRLNTSLGQSYIRFLTNGGGMAFNTTNNAGTYYQTMYMANGNVGIGTTNPGAALHLNQDRYTLYGPNSSWSSYLRVGGNGGAIGVDGVGYASVATTNGNLHLDASSVGPGKEMYLNWYKGIAVRVGNGTSGAYGPVYAASYNIASDQRLKERIESTQNNLDKINKLRPVSYYLKDSKDQTQQIGFIAQEVKQVFPEIVSQDSDGHYALNYSVLVAPLAGAVQELAKENEQLKTQINELKSLMEKNGIKTGK